MWVVKLRNLVAPTDNKGICTLYEDAFSACPATPMLPSPYPSETTSIDASGLILSKSLSIRDNRLGLPVSNNTVMLLTGAICTLTIGIPPFFRKIQHFS